MSRADISDATRSQVHEIAALIPPKKSSTALRKAQNEIIRQRISSLSNDVISRLCYIYSHDLSFRELRKRLESESIQDLSELFRILELSLSYRRKGEIGDLIVKEILRVGKTAQASEIVELSADFVHTRMHRDVWIIERIASVREDRENLLKIIPKERL